MKNKLWFLTKMSLNKKIKTKWFIAANIFIFLLIVCVVNIDSIIKFFGGEFEHVDKILVIDNANAYEKFKTNYDELYKYIGDNNSEISLTEKTIEDLKPEIKEDDKILIVFNEDENEFLKVELITKNNINTITYQVITNAINGVKKDMALSHYNISNEILAIVNSPVTITTTKLDESKTLDETMNLIMGTVFPLIILPFFMLTMFLVQMIGAEINEEKTTKGMEIIISNVSPKTHFFSKILAGNIFVLIQGAILLVSCGIALIIRKYTAGSLITPDIQSTISGVVTMLTDSGVLSKLIIIIPLTLILMILTFIGYSLLAGILASMTTNMEDYQQVQTPIIIISLVGYYLSIMAGMFEGSALIKVASYFPFISALLSPALLLIGQISVFDVLISIAIMIAILCILFKYGIKIYKVGILNYSSSNLWKKMFKAVKIKERKTK